MTARTGGNLTDLQWAAVLGSVTILLWSVPGLIVHPDFGVGDAASSKRIIGADMNGWHAVSGFLVAIPCLLALRRPRLLAILLAASAAGLIATGIWAMFSTRVAGVFDFPNNEADAALHFVTSTFFLFGVARYRRDQHRGAGPVSATHDDDRAAPAA